MRIAGVNVGKVTEVEAEGDAVEVTFTRRRGRASRSTTTPRSRSGRASSSRATSSSTSPGQPERAGARRRRQIPITQTSTAVQLDEVLTALQAPTRKGLQKTLDGFGTALNYEPTAADDLSQDPDVAGETAGESLNEPSRYGGTAGRGTAIVSKALRGENPGDLAGFIRRPGPCSRSSTAAATTSASLITNFNIFAGALATESANLSETIAELDADARGGRDVARDLNDALPPIRALAIDSRPGIQELPATIDAFEPWLAADRPAARSQRELGGLAQLLQEHGAGRSPGEPRRSRSCSPRRPALSRCSTANLIPTGRHARSPPTAAGASASRTSTSSSTAWSSWPAPARASTATAPTCACSPAAARCSSAARTRPASRPTRSTSRNTIEAPGRDPAGAASARRRRSGWTSPCSHEPASRPQWARGRRRPG